MLNSRERAFNYQEAQTMARRMDELGTPHEIIIEALMAHGLSHYAAENIVSGVLEPAGNIPYVDRYAVEIGLFIVTLLMVFMSLLFLVVSLQQ